MSSLLTHASRFLLVSLLVLAGAPAFAAAHLTYRDGLEEYESGNFEIAFLTYQRLAENGDAESQNALAHMYFLGETGEQDYPRAVQWFQRAAEQGIVAAQLSLADLYGRGLGVARSDADAYKWYTVAELLASEADHKRLALANRDRIGRRMPADARVDALLQACAWWRGFRSRPVSLNLGTCAVD